MRDLTTFGISLLTTCLLTFAASNSNADLVVYDNLPGGAAQIDGLYSTSSAVHNAGTFTFASTTNVSGFEWSGVYFPTDAPPATDAIVVSIFSDDGGLPGTLQNTFNVESQIVRSDSQSDLVLGNGTYDVYNFAAPISFTANSNSKYWISIVNNGVVDFSWGGQNSASDRAFTVDGGSSWLTANTGRLDFRLTSVPEPSSMLILGVIAAAVVSRRRK